jgi:hypothetical protein
MMVQRAGFRGIAYVLLRGVRGPMEKFVRRQNKWDRIEA